MRIYKQEGKIQDFTKKCFVEFYVQPFIFCLYASHKKQQIHTFFIEKETIPFFIEKKTSIYIFTLNDAVFMDLVLRVICITHYNIIVS